MMRTGMNAASTQLMVSGTQKYPAVRTESSSLAEVRIVCQTGATVEVSGRVVGLELH